ncbi:MAG: serine hydrolase [Pseudomonadota bacterium]
MTASGPFGAGRKSALHREGVGCTVENKSLKTVDDQAVGIQSGAQWVSKTDENVFAALKKAFADKAQKHRALLVIADGEIIAEQYADGFSETTPFLSWSMAKSVTATLIGAAVEDGLIDINSTPPLQAWEKDEARRKITWDDLLRMQSGLTFEEKYEKPRSQVNRMLFEEPGAGAYAATSDIEAAPGEIWSYSSGTSNILAYAFYNVIRKTGKNPVEYAFENIFFPIGADSFVMEPDASGVFIGSSFAYATARDWARLGQLYLQDGVWNGERILPKSWAAYVSTPTPKSSGQYGAHFWLNRPQDPRGDQFFDALPADMYFMAGHEGQYVFVFPSQNLVIVRLGVTRGRSAMKAVEPVIADIFQAATAR